MIHYESETGVGKAVGEFEGGCTVMETWQGALRVRLRHGRLGGRQLLRTFRVSQVQGALRGDSSRGAVIDTIARNIEREMDVVDIEEGSNKTTRMYAKDLSIYLYVYDYKL
ncbi:Hypothetical predicted protein [Olea europaea subsp. europaea]|uniref:Uncharacterized protein n=1 Tax=Olea europaea subsp. europaea TaxID=158383 RepID=A0A8S0S283_OLEEU|nr:Hypothetical predicted protein [Olea europaea subsp. europaea]